MAGELQLSPSNSNAERSTNKTDLTQALTPIPNDR